MEGEPMNDTPVPLFTPPDIPTRSTMDRMSLASLPVRGSDSTDLLSVAVLDRSGRFSVRRHVAALGWQPGSPLGFQVRAATVLISKTTCGQHRIDARGQLFLPSGTRTFLGLSSGDRVVVVAMLHHGMLLVQPVSAVLTQIVERCPVAPSPSPKVMHNVHPDKTAHGGAP
jgi:bifunctional DNA-binding transcriptional regulator/antitoxin component of YhaV-PrlF toxin-antitoxin module